jgi:membrane fusion protein (multidrug efflux system)
VNVGQWVASTTRVLSVYEPDPLRLQLTVPEADIALLKQDMIVAFSVAAFGEDKFQGMVKFISPNVREATRDLVVEAVVPNVDAKLRPGMFAVAKVALGEHPRPVVPLAAIVKDDTTQRAYVVVNGLIQERTVQLGSQVGDLVAVLAGVKTGENVVLSPSPDVRDGAKVEGK